MRHRQSLFSKVSWFDLDRKLKEDLKREIVEYSENDLLNTSTEALIDYFESKYLIDVPEIVKDDIELDQRSTKIDVSHDPLRVSFGRGPTYVDGFEVIIEIPFNGDPDVFNIQPSSRLLKGVYADIVRNKIIYKIEEINVTQQAVGNAINGILSDLESFLGNLRRDISPYNNALRGQIESIVENRKKHILQSKNALAGLGFKLKQRPGSNTYTAPVKRKQIQRPSPGSSPKKPEPVLALEQYEDILDTMSNMAQVMELSPSAFVGMDEESLRSHFLVQLNGKYEGNATGETFNKYGKKDIIIKENGKNIFIGECKFWGGPKVLTSTINQILSYSSWRDTKVAIVIFNKNKSLSKVASSIPECLRSHPNYKKEIPQESETRFRFVMHNNDDKDRDMLLTVMIFDVPTSK